MERSQSFRGRAYTLVELVASKRRERGCIGTLRNNRLTHFHPHPRRGDFPRLSDDAPTSTPEGFGTAAAIWLVVTQWLSSAFGGYLTGRLRTKWVGIRTDEVLFRDTAHGHGRWRGH